MGKPGTKYMQENHVDIEFFEKSDHLDHDHFFKDAILELVSTADIEDLKRIFECSIIDPISEEGKAILSGEKKPKSELQLRQLKKAKGNKKITYVAILKT